MSTQATDVLATVDGAPPPAKADTPDPAVARLEATIREQGSQIAAVTRALQSRPVPNAAPASAAAPAPNKEALRQEFFKEPMDMTAAIAYRAAQDVMAQQGQQGAETLKQIARDKVRGSDPELFDRYAHEIDALVAQNTQPQFHGNINVWQSAANMVYGAHRNELTPRKAVDAPEIRTSDGPSAPNTRQAQPPARQQLTDDERRVARGMGLTDEQYSRGKGRIEQLQGTNRWQSKDDAFDDKTVQKARRERAAAGK